MLVSFHSFMLLYCGQQGLFTTLLHASSIAKQLVDGVMHPSVRGLHESARHHELTVAGHSLMH
jgi:hypothetical protein